jgi:hypothetical protein
MVSSGQASGWNDFEHDIGDGYHVIKMSSLEVSIGRDKGPLVLCGSKGSAIGSVNRYMATPDHSLVRTLGRKPVT